MCSWWYQDYIKTNQHSVYHNTVSVLVRKGSILSVLIAILNKIKQAVCNIFNIIQSYIDFNNPQTLHKQMKAEKAFFIQVSRRTATHCGWKNRVGCNFTIMTAWELARLEIEQS